MGPRPIELANQEAVPYVPPVTDVEQDHVTLTLSRSMGSRFETNKSATGKRSSVKRLVVRAEADVGYDQINGSREMRNAPFPGQCIGVWPVASYACPVWYVMSLWEMLLKLATGRRSSKPYERGEECLLMETAGILDSISFHVWNCLVMTQRGRMNGLDSD